MLLRGWLSYGKALAHLFQFFGADAFDGQEIVNGFEGAVGFAGVQDFLRGGWADAGDLLKFGGAGGVEIDGVRERFLFAGAREKDARLSIRPAKKTRVAECRRLNMR